MIYLVSGFPRSGTSMVMQACEAGGMTVVCSEARDEFNVINSDKTYRPNPRGLYEPRFIHVRQPGFWLAHHGKAVKCIVPWLGHLETYRYNVVFMLRDAEEIRQSLRAAFNFREPYFPEKPPTVEKIQRDTDEALEMLRGRRDVMSLLTLRYREDVIAEPLAAMTRLAEAGWPLYPRRAAAVVDPAWCRFRREALVDGL